jgi:hypothetical protein
VVAEQQLAQLLSLQSLQSAHFALHFAFAASVLVLPLAAAPVVIEQDFPLPAVALEAQQDFPAAAVFASQHLPSHFAPQDLLQSLQQHAAHLQSFPLTTVVPAKAEVPTNSKIGRINILKNFLVFILLFFCSRLRGFS